MCTAAYIALLFGGYMPPPGTVVTVPKEIVLQYSDRMKSRAIRCAHRFKIELRSE